MYFSAHNSRRKCTRHSAETTTKTPQEVRVESYVRCAKQFYFPVRHVSLYRDFYSFLCFKDFFVLRLAVQCLFIRRCVHKLTSCDLSFHWRAGCYILLLYRPMHLLHVQQQSWTCLILHVFAKILNGLTLVKKYLTFCC